MNSDDICKILKAAKDTGVTKIKVGTLLIEFGNLTNELFPLNNSNTIPLVSDVKLADGTKGQSETPDPKELANEFDMAQLMANDPEAFEKRLRES